MWNKREGTGTGFAHLTAITLQNSANFVSVSDYAAHEVSPQVLLADEKILVQHVSLASIHTRTEYAHGLKYSTADWPFLRGEYTSSGDDPDKEAETMEKKFEDYSMMLQPTCCTLTVTIPLAMISWMLGSRMRQMILTWIRFSGHITRPNGIGERGLRRICHSPTTIG